jgi:hypothetical protein
VTIATLAMVAAVVVVAALLSLVVSMHRRLGRLGAEVAALQHRDVVAEVRPADPIEPATVAARTPVALITGLPVEGGSDETTGAVTTGRIVSVTLAEPMIKVAALVAGLRRALDDEHRMRVSYAFRRELKRQRKLRRRAAAARARQAQGGVP